MRKAVIIYGPPGSGKGTQANLLASEKGFVHFDTGKYVEELVNRPEHKNNPVIQREKHNFDTGKLMTPSFILEIASEETKKLFEEGKGMVYSASPRTLHEAFGDEKTPGLYEVFENLFGKENVHVVHITVSAETSIKRNSARGRENLDDPEVIKVRLVEYKNRTEPIFEKLRERGYNIIEIDGEPDKEDVHKNILRQLEL